MDRGGARTQARAAHRSRPSVATLAWLALAACTSLAAPSPGEPSRAPRARAEVAVEPSLEVTPLRAEQVCVRPAPRTIEEAWILDLYTWLHARDYRVERLRFPGSDGEPAEAYLSLPASEGPHPAVLVFPILAGSHVVSEGLSKALVRRGFAVLRMQRRALDLEDADGPERPMAAFRHALRDARALLPWLAARPDIDGERIATAGVSLGGILAATLMGIEPRVRAGYFAMTGGDLAEILWESSEVPVRKFRERLMRERGLGTREAFLELVRPYTESLDPLRYAEAIPPERVLLVSGRFDRVIPPARTRELWERLGRPTWRLFPAGHYQFAPFFWWAAARAADHFDRVLGDVEPIAAVRRAEPSGLRAAASEAQD